MKCPFCRVEFHVHWDHTNLTRPRNGTSPIVGKVRHTLCPACGRTTFEMSLNLRDYFQIYPVGGSRPPAPSSVPEKLAEDFAEACLVLASSAKASAALSRRCLQGVLHDNGYTGKNLADEIQMLLDEDDPKKSVPDSIRTTVDLVRNFGNFSAHPVTDITGQQVIPVEAHEADYCLDVLEELFDYFYERPAQARARKAALDKKLAEAGKPPSK